MMRGGIGKKCRKWDWENKYKWGWRNKYKCAGGNDALEEKKKGL